MALIVEALPTNKLHLIRSCSTAKQLWNQLREDYRPANSLRATTMKGNILGYRYEAGMSVKKWADNMQEMNIKLMDMDPDLMPDNEFARHVVDLMPHDGPWSYVSRELAGDVHTGKSDL